MRRFLTSVLVAMSALLTGCASPSIADSVHAGLPEGLDVDPMSEGPAGVWVEDDTRFAVITWGSSSCPAVAKELNVESDDHLALIFGRSSNDPCTADMAPTTHEFELPDGITDRPLTITASYEDWDDTHILTLE